MDGVGISPKDKGNAVKQAKTPNLDKLYNDYPHICLEASGKAVGLPTNQMGNSEVGHLNIGAGRVVYTGLSIIDKAIEDGSFYTNDAFKNAIAHCKKYNSKFHILGLVSHGGVHSCWEHIIELIKLAHINNVNSVLHIITDGRDVAPQSFLNDWKTLKPILEENNCKWGSVVGRYWAMDRDKNWDRVNLAFENLTTGVAKSNGEYHYINYQNMNELMMEGKHYSIEEFLSDYYNNVDVFCIQERKTQLPFPRTDEYIPPLFNSGFGCQYSTKEINIEDNDSVIFANFRPDRARELSHLFIGSELYPNVKPHGFKNLYFVTMMKYDGINPNAIAFANQKIANGLGETLSKNNCAQLRIAETEKYAHVTFFFDGGEDIDYKGETKIIIPSPKVNYSDKPEMSAYEITDKIIKNKDNFDTIIVNYANGDMVGHTGNLNATIKAVEVVDECIGKILSALNDFTFFITADHGNADVMLNDNDEIVTSHSTNPVPFIITDKDLSFTKQVGKLADIAPTLLKYKGIAIPSEMDGSPLI